MAPTRRRETPRRQKAKQKSRGVSSRSKPSRKPDLQKRAFQVFATQADPLWTDLIDQCREFADGFNKALGGTELHVRAAPTTLRVVYPRADAVLLVELDKAERYVRATLDAGCVDGSCAAGQPAVGLTVNGNQLRFVLSGEVVSNEQLAVALLTQLTSGKSKEQQS